MNGFLTAESLQDYATLVGAVVVLVQFFKGPADAAALRIFKGSLPTKYVAYAFSLGLVALKANREGALALDSLPFICFNAVIAALAAMKAFEEFAAAGASASPADARQ
ncbi:MAG TPA: hypothetical protein VK464_19780 [Symbiobacteriaceae bacterium]|jgi:hypothetical protein|nr:hypothetical protein [Symbiobacteriaceae bacterium]